VTAGTPGEGGAGGAWDRLRARLGELRAEAEEELAAQRRRFRYRIERGRVEFEAEARTAHRAARERLASFLSRTRPLVVLTAPVIYGMIVPIFLLDVAVRFYQAVCFPVYGIARVRRSDYVIIDRHRLEYLNGLQKLNCVYCGYANGVIAFVREVAARTELYWCPIKHARTPPDPHGRYPEFLDFGDAEGFRAGLEERRRRLRGEDR
jgi:hypothetical protein